MNRLVLLGMLALALAPLAGCLGKADAFDFTPGTDYKDTGRTVHLKATVVDLVNTEVYPGFHANLWAFCFEPVDPADSYSAGAIEQWTPLPTDAKVPGHPDGSCSVPGPTLRVHQGDRVIVEFSHTHFHPHTIHWHGQYVPWQSDGAQGVTQDAVQSGGSITYDFVAKRAGTLWYHCHVDAPTHVMQGLYGMVIVEPQDTKWEPKDVGHEETLVLSTMNRNAVEAVPGAGLHSHPPGCASGFPGCQNPPTKAGDPDVFLINGHSYPYTEQQDQSVIHIAPGERVRIRMLNAGETTEEMHLHGHDMQVVAVDGNPLPPGARYWVDTVTLGPAQRVDVVVEGNNPGPWLFHTHIDSHATNCGKFPGGMHTMMVYPGFEHQMDQFKAEADATCPFQSVMQLPGDFNNHTARALGNSNGSPGAVTGSWDWPVQLPCAVRKLGFYASLDSGTVGSIAGPVPNAGSSVTVVVKKPDGSEATRFTLKPDSPYGTYELTTARLADLTTVAGNYTVELSGTATDAHLDLDVTVDYYETFEQSKTAHLQYKVGGCPGYT
jgi:plastocyanin